jgi:microcystin-dependent protein
MTTATDESTATAVQNKYGGIWVAWGQGRVPVGMNSNGTFNTLEKTGGAETHTLGAGEMPSHTHTGPSHAHTMSHTHTGPSHNHSTPAHKHKLLHFGSGGSTELYNWNTNPHGYYGKSYRYSDPVWSDEFVESVSAGNTGSAGTGNTGAASNSTTSSDGTGNTGSAGSGSAHNNLQPYITCYMYKRTT